MRDNMVKFHSGEWKLEAVYPTTESVRLETHLEFPLHVLEIDPVALPRGPLSAPRAEVWLCSILHDLSEKKGGKKETPDPLSR
jgi:hypothetical protein